MPAERYFIETPYSLRQEVLLEGQEFHHLVNVMRAKTGGLIELVNGKGQLAKAVIGQIEKKRGLAIIQELFSEPPPCFEIILSQAIPRLNRLDFILEKGTELGMTQIWLFEGDHSERKEFSENQTERIKAVMIAAMKQCGRLYLPRIEIMPPLNKWKMLPFPSFYGDVNPKAVPFHLQWMAKTPSSGVIFFVGPESGLTALETETLNGLGVQGVKLNPHILRTETASISALSLISHFLMTQNDHLI